MWRKRAIPCSQQEDTISAGQLDTGQGARSRPSPGHHARDKRATSGDAHTRTSREVGTPKVKGRPTGPHPYSITVSYSAANPPKKPAVTGFSPAGAASTDIDSRRTLASTPYSAANTRFTSVEAKYVVVDSSIRGGVQPIRGGLNAFHGRSPICRSNMVGNPSARLLRAGIRQRWITHQNSPFTAAVVRRGYWLPRDRLSAT